MIAVLGECVADAFADRRPGELELRVLPGGGPANTAVALARLGTSTRFLGRVSGDVFGELFREHLASSGVDLSACVPAAEPSTLAVASLDERGQAAYIFHAEGTADWQWTPEELAALDPRGWSCLHTGSLALVRRPGGAAVEEFAADARRHATISIDPNVRPSLAGREDYTVERWCAVADILKLSDDDLSFLAPDVPVERACDAWHAAGARLIVITRGASGALVSLDGERTAVRAPQVKVVDTVGAGDSFTAGLLHRLGVRGLLGGRLEGLDLETAADAAAFAARVAARTCSVAGANPPWAHQLNEPAGL
ncbi:carbohydrate kinase [Nonomuraea sp. NEAU-A123]|uniref:carbohydrate kinase family protein n=1 Tax=Nonomuraea sp. NEAU-A123 TaxID=2839649 RepID=UPI001BE409FC|nr:carbohydrate kinase [Nonomuraea sp. NEAU-A123]MBT2235296.1 carbohydrate kinase [Nonomuraea sp. NEAU-A123]